MKVLRIDHGVRCVEDPELVRELAQKEIPLTVCPISNVKLCVFPSMEKHNVKYLMDQGLFITINSDDPAYVGGYVGDNYLAVQSTFNLTKEEIYRLAKNSFRASFLPEAEKGKYIAEVDAFMAANK